MKAILLAPILLIPAGLSSAQPNSAEEWRRIGLAAMSKGDLKGAGPALQKACELEQAPGDSCYYYGRNLHAMGDFEAARTAFESALKSAPRELTGRIYRATALNYMALGRNGDAERDFRKAIALAQPDQEDARVDLGSFLFRQGRVAEAHKLLEAAFGAKPDSARANLESGRVLLHLEQLPAAMKRLETAVRLNPADWNAHLLLGRAYQRAGRDADAERELQLGESEWRRKQP
jgi:tetratricopeptide (TPR) repeat protein